MTILINHIGYGSRENKTAVIQSLSEKRPLIQLFSASGKLQAEYPCPELKQCGSWHTGPAAKLDFSEITRPGEYYFSWGKEQSRRFTIYPETMDHVICGDLMDYFHRQRSNGATDRFDRKVPFFGQRRKEKVDLHGGWYDASGDVSKYLSHLSYTNFMGPQQTPLVVWALLHSASILQESQKKQAMNEALYGADFLVRMCDDQGYFYQIVFDRWTKDLSQRNVCNYSTQQGFKSERWEASFRQGGGMAIAALARAAITGQSGDFSSETYLKTAEKAFAHLKKHNSFYLDNLQENIIDYYCSLMAAAELYNSTRKEEYADYAYYRMDQLLKLQHEQGWWYAEMKMGRPFFHASDEGMPVVSLYRAKELLGTHPGWKNYASGVESALGKAGDFYLESQSGADNPFGYPRQMTRSLNGPIKQQYFFPHHNESGYWWQGENARLGSLYSAAMMIEMSADREKKKALGLYRQRLKDWLLGLNPFDAAMIEGRGFNNPLYDEDWPGVMGGICNGITSGLTDEEDIALCASKDPLQSWRWGEQWIPHAAWWLIALTGLS